MNIFIEDIVANGIIEKNKLDGSRKISIKQAENYGEEVINYLKEKNIDCIMYLNRELTYLFQIKYRDLFTRYSNQFDKGYILKDDKNIDDLITIFRGYLPLDTLLAFTDKEVIEKGLVNKKKKILKLK